MSENVKDWYWHCPKCNQDYSYDDATICHGGKCWCGSDVKLIKEKRTMTLEEAIKIVQNFYDACDDMFYEWQKPAFPLILSAAEKWAAREWWYSVTEKERLAYIDDFHGTVSEYPLFAYRKAREK